MAIAGINRELKLTWDKRDGVHLTAEDHRDDAPRFVGMQYVRTTLDRTAINKLIADLRRARDEAYGADQ